MYQDTPMLDDVRATASRRVTLRPGLGVRMSAMERRRARAKRLPATTTTKRTSWSTILGSSLAKILYAVPSKKAKRIGGRSPRDCINAGNYLPT
jgi:hypothetical protein